MREEETTTIMTIKKKFVITLFYYCSIFQKIFLHPQLTIVLGTVALLKLTDMIEPQELQVNNPNKSLKASTTGLKSSLVKLSHYLGMAQNSFAPFSRYLVKRPREFFLTSVYSRKTKRKCFSIRGTGNTFIFLSPTNLSCLVTTGG